MKMSKKLLTSGVAAAVAAMGLAATSANAYEISATAAVANMYLWRGQDLGAGAGVPAVSGDIKITESGFTAGVWGSSGDEALGTEYDLWVGYGGSVGDFRYDLSVWNYVYPSLGGVDDGDNIGDFSDVILTLGYGPVTFAYYDVVAGNYDYSYMTLGAAFGAFSATLGYALTKDGAAETVIVDETEVTTYDDSDYTHLDVSYAYNENLAFTLSQVVSESDDSPVDDDLKFVVKYSLPIK